MLNKILVLFFVLSSTLAFVGAKEIQKCGEQEWQCRDESCIDMKGRCNGTAECLDGSDEIYATCRNNRCPYNMFRCAYGACIDASGVCDDQPNCHDLSDDVNSKCSNVTDTILGRFKCKNGQTIPSAGLCDGILDCDDKSDESIYACTTQTCPSIMYQCAYGACVDQGANCNGVNDCADGSDERDDICKWKPVSELNLDLPPGHCLLPSYPDHGGYTVAGAPNAVPALAFDAVTLNVFCDIGYGFDENNVINCTKGIWSGSMPSCSAACKLDKHESVEYMCINTVDNKQTKTRCGEYVLPGTLVHPECKRSYYYPETIPKYMRCLWGNWDHVVTCNSGSCKLPTHRSISYYECEKKYDKIKKMYVDEEIYNDDMSGMDYADENIEYIKVNCNKELMLEGSVIYPKCMAYHYLFDPESATARCVQGSWNSSSLCTPECGQWNIWQTQTEFPPWHAFIYSKLTTPYEQICGGSLIKENIVISAAQCFWTNKQQPEANYAVAVGKFYRNWDHPEDYFVQQSDVRQINIPSQFKGPLSNYEANIALVVVESEFTFNDYVNRICLDFDIEFNTRQLLGMESAKVVGWTFTRDRRKSSQNLKTADIPYLKIRDCISRAYTHTPHMLPSYFTDDKICVGSIDGSDTSLCKLDGGEGLAFPDYDIPAGIYYLRGVVSFAPTKRGACNITYAVSTHLIEYKNYIKDFMSQLK